MARRKKGKCSTVTWYGGLKRRDELSSDTGQWYRIGQGLVPRRWVHVRDREGTHRDDYVYSTDPSLAPAQIVSYFTDRWPIETTFREVRNHLGFETTRQRIDKSVLRAAPCLLGLFSVDCLIYAEHLKTANVSLQQTPWHAKTERTLADALAAVRRLLWEQSVFQQSRSHTGFSKAPAPAVPHLLDLVSRAA